MIQFVDSSDSPRFFLDSYLIDQLPHLSLVKCFLIKKIIKIQELI